MFDFNLFVRKEEYDKLLNCLIILLKRSDEDCCSYCKNVPKDENIYKCCFTCEDVKCDKFDSGDKANLDGKEIDWKWTCRDFNFGDCPALENTPCYNCAGSNDNFELDLDKLENLLRGD